MALAQTATNTTPTICTEPGSGLAGSAIGTPRLFFRADNSMAEPGVAGCTSVALSLEGSMAQQTQKRFCTREAVRDTFYGFQGNKWQMKWLWERRQRPRAGTTT